MWRGRSSGFLYVECACLDDIQLPLTAPKYEHGPNWDLGALSDQNSTRGLDWVGDD